jgi:hypothetical protein|tara:strand:+ start:1465 stop:2070 length:606 start_codon:yes stop_codon:yes gene_type:complete
MKAKLLTLLLSATSFLLIACGEDKKAFNPQNLAEQLEEQYQEKKAQKASETIELFGEQVTRSEFIQKEKQLIAKYKKVSPEKFYELAEPWLWWFHKAVKEKNLFYYEDRSLKGYWGEFLYYSSTPMLSNMGTLEHGFPYGNDIEYPLWAIYLFETERELGKSVISANVGNAGTTTRNQGYTWVKSERFWSYDKSKDQRLQK